ncbi:MAG: phosphopentomutase [Alphaproteobacteria bacterium]|nr:phosphopentomutase [Alphaproteobacteria bacterium]
MARAIILVMDSFGIGGAGDAAAYGDEGADTFGHIVDNYPDLQIPNLIKLGLAQAAGEASGVQRHLTTTGAKIDLPAKFGHCREISLAKDTTSGHWEIAGVPVLEPWGYFKPDYPSFPADLVAKICQRAGLNGILGNKAASGTVIIQELGEEHIHSLKPIFYTSADSNLQIAAHEKYFGLERLYALCQIAYEEVKPYHIARVIARPFIGEKNSEFTRTGNRHDYSVPPIDQTLLDIARQAGREVFAIGKISDIFAGSGVSRKLPASGHTAIWEQTFAALSEAPEGSLIFTNFVDFDMLYGHRRDLNGYAKALEEFDARLPELADRLQQDDVVFITADHGNDPTAKGSDHTREQVPVLAIGRGITPENIGERKTFADIGQSAAKVIGLKQLSGTSFL